MTLTADRYFFPQALAMRLLLCVMACVLVIWPGYASAADGETATSLPYRQKLMKAYDLIASATFVYRPDEVDTIGEAALQKTGKARLYALWSVMYAYKDAQNSARFQYWHDRIVAKAHKDGDSDLDLFARLMLQAYQNETDNFENISPKDWDVYLNARNSALQNMALLERQRQAQYARNWAEAIDLGETLVIRLNAEGRQADAMMIVAQQVLAYNMVNIGDYESYADHMLTVADRSRSNGFFLQKMSTIYDLAYFAAQDGDLVLAQRLQQLYGKNVQTNNIQDLRTWDQELCAVVAGLAEDFRKVVNCLAGTQASLGEAANRSDVMKMLMLTEAHAHLYETEKARFYLGKLKALPPSMAAGSSGFYSLIDTYLLAGDGHYKRAFERLSDYQAVAAMNAKSSRIAAIQDMYKTLRKELDSKDQKARLLNRQVEMQRWLLIAAVAIGLLLLTLAAVSVIWVMRMRRMQWKLREAHEHAQAANAAKSRFLAVMSHELRTPLNGVLGMAQALRKGELNPVQRNQVDILVESGETLMVLLNDVLDMSRIEAGKVELAPTSASMKDMIERVINTYAPTIEDKPVVLRYDIDDSAMQVMSFDVLRVYQCLSNLVSNAAKFTERGTIRMVASAKKHGDKPGYLVRVEVRDTGIGMSKSTIERLFEAYAQADAGTARKYGGSGLGLSISRRLTELMQGTLSVTSEEGAGTTFVMTFHAGEVEPTTSKMPARPEAAVVTPAAPHGVRILLVDDHPVNRKVARLFLEPFGFDITEAADGQEALDLGMEQYDLVLMDINMPRLGGIEATRMFRDTEETGRHVPIIALTADAMPEQIEACLAAGMDAHVSKPIVMDRLIETVTSLLHVDTPEEAAPMVKAG